jgi:hypothetical protein
MEEPRTWIVCRHVVEGLAEKAILSKDLTCLCLDCKDDPDMMEPEDLCILDESLLVERLKHISCNGSSYIDKNNNQKRNHRVFKIKS